MSVSLSFCFDFIGLYSVNGTHNFCAYGILLVPRVTLLEWPMGLKIDYYICRAQILVPVPFRSSSQIIGYTGGRWPVGVPFRDSWELRFVFFFG